MTREQQIDALKDLARSFNREGEAKNLNDIIAVLDRIWPDNAAAVCFYTALERTFISRRCVDLSTNFRGNWQ